MPEPRTDFASRRDRFRQYEDSQAVEAYLQRLEREWPERAEIAQLIADQIALLDLPVPVVLELCCGPGRLAQTLLETLPTMHYTGLDLSPPFLAYAQTQLSPYAERVTLCETDLSSATWPAILTEQGHNKRFHAIVSMQSLHDVGDEATISQIYGEAKELLLPGGLFLNADLIVPPGESLPNNPGRLTIQRHLELLRHYGYRAVNCLWTGGGFGCVMGVN